MNELLIKIGLTEEDSKELSQCINPAIKTFEKDEIILDLANSGDEIGFIVNGLAYFVSSTFDGQKNIVDIFNDSGVFGKPLCPTMSGNVYYILAKKKCKVGFITYDKLLHCCHNRCQRHIQIMEYVVNSYAKSTQVHMEILSRRNIRDKLSCYFRYLSIQRDSRQIRIPVPYTDLADYLAVDRSAMMRELKKMSDDKLIILKGKQILLFGLNV